MINPSNVLSIFNKLFTEKYSNFSETECTSDEKRIAENVFNYFEQSLCTNDIEEVESLDFVDSEDEFNENIDYKSDPDYDPNDYANDGEILSFNYIKSVVDYRNNTKSGKKRCWSSIVSRFRKLEHKSEKVIYYEKVVKQGGSRVHKLQSVNDHVLSKFIRARESHLPVHDIDLQIWAINAAKALNLENFSASEFYIRSFKNRNKIRSRKITKLVSRVTELNANKIIANAKQFVENSKPILDNYSEDHTINTDQSGFHYELISNRTLSNVGEKDTLLQVNSIHATTHSYTLQYAYTKSGYLLPKVFLCLQESDYDFGERVSEEISYLRTLCPNMVISCSRSGKMDKNLVKQFNELLLKSYVTNDFVLILDSWNGHKDEKIYQSAFDNNECKLIVIPPHCTPLIQPLDVFWFRQLKAFIKRISNVISLHNLDYKLSNRKNVIKLQSLAHNQLSSDKFVNMIKYGWYKSGFIEEYPGNFDTVNEICFKNVLGNTCSCCDSYAIIKCSHCSMCLCIKHFFEDEFFHFH